MSKLFVGVDVSKDSFSATGLDVKGDVRFSLSLTMDKTGFSELMKAITSNCKDLSAVMAGMESTGCYHINLFSFLSSKEINAVVINPLLISNFAKLSLRKTKTDKKDSLTIARFILIHKDSIEQFSISQDIRDFRDIARERESISHLIASTKNEIKRILQSIFPELESICNVFTATLLLFLKEFPSARFIRASKAKVVADALERYGKGRKVSINADDIIKAAKSSIASNSLAKELILPQKISTLLHLMEQLDKITGILSEFCESIAIQEMKIITSIDGIGDTTGAMFLAEVGDISNFSGHKSLIAFAGLDPTVFQSGKFKGASRISKRGNRHLRRIVYLMTIGVIRCNAFFKAYFLKRKQDGLPFRKAVMAVAHKLIRTIFAMLSHKSHFRVKENSL
ncbi:MAG: IS110 family transposase [Nitrospirae bacterium]|nr:IS110 family transposase [Nitrospirota bacterium]